MFKRKRMKSRMSRESRKRIESRKWELQNQGLIVMMMMPMLSLPVILLLVLESRQLEIGPAGSRMDRDADDDDDMAEKEGGFMFGCCCCCCW